MKQRPLTLLLLTAAAGCAGTYQSAHTLAPGKTQVTADITAARATDNGDTSDTVMTGELMVRHGLDDGLDGGIRLGRLPDDDSTSSASALSFDIKKRLSDSETNTISLDIPAGILWSESGLNFSDGILHFTPTLLVGLQVDPSTEVVFGPKFILLLNPENDSSDHTAIGGGATLGVRFSDAARTYGIQPELGIAKVEDIDVILTFGIAVAAGN